MRWLPSTASEPFDSCCCALTVMLPGRACALSWLPSLWRCSPSAAVERLFLLVARLPVWLRLHPLPLKPLPTAAAFPFQAPTTAEEDELLHESLLSGGAPFFTATHPLLLPPALCALRRPAPTAEEDELLRESLLSGGVDVEAGQGGTKKRQHSWISLVGIAAQYMWPDSFALQVRGWLGGNVVVLGHHVSLCLPTIVAGAFPTRLASTAMPAAGPRLGVCGAHRRAF